MLKEICEALGWQGGTVHQAKEAVLKLTGDEFKNFSEKLSSEAKWAVMEWLIENARRMEGVEE